MTDLVERRDLLRIVTMYNKPKIERWKLVMFIDSLKTCDPPSPEERKATWKHSTEERHYGVVKVITCSNCGDKHLGLSETPNYCECCGCKMEDE